MSRAPARSLYGIPPGMYGVPMSERFGLVRLDPILASEAASRQLRGARLHVHASPYLL